MFVFKEEKMIKWIKNYFRRRRYNKYIKSPEWKKFRRLVLQRDGYKCFVCESNKEPLEVHHLHYEKNLYKTKMYQCITLCKTHHKKIHKKSFT